MSDELGMVSYVMEENKRRKRRRIVLMKQYFEIHSSCNGIGIS
jgi:hypothetical protein